MKKLYLSVLITFLLINIFCAYPPFQIKVKLLPENFEDKAFNHIKNLVSLGPRPAGSKNEMKAAEYIQRQFNEIGLKTEIEIFEYKSFEFMSLDLRINNIHYQPVGLGYTPYRNIYEFEGSAVFIDLNDLSSPPKQEIITGKTIISNDFTSHFQLLRFRPKLIIYVNPNDFIEMKSSGDHNYKLKISGQYKKFKSPNVIAQLGRSYATQKEILIGAHLDSYRDSPGANDNGSGVAVMIELARYLQKMKSKHKGTIKFIAFGAEELGILGSRRYVKKNCQSLKKCELYFNIDDVGGNGLGAISLGELGVIKLPPKLEDKLSNELAVNPWEGVTSYWRLLPEAYLMGFLTTVNHPEWLVKNIKNSIAESGYNIQYSKNPGADDMAFSHSGIVSTYIVIQGDATHTPGDSLDKVNKTSLRKAGEITIRVILKTLKSLK